MNFNLGGDILMVNIRKIKSHLALKDMTLAELSKEMGISKKTLYDRIKKGVFTTKEVEKISRILEIEDILDVFFPDLNHMKKFTA